MIIMSYDILRNDVDQLRAVTFNYCVLDEGHIIKNAKTKITQAVKQVHANHRLILSGTPVQVPIIIIIHVAANYLHCVLTANIYCV